MVEGPVFPFVQIYDGVPQIPGGGGGGGVTEARVMELIAAAKPDVVVEVSHDFLASDQYNQYPTINQGLNRARALQLTPGIMWVEVKVYPGYWDEEGMRVSDNIVLAFEQGAFVRGPVVPTNQYPIAAPTMAALVIVEGTGQIKDIRLKPQNPNPVIGALVVLSGEVPCNRAVINGIFFEVIGETLVSCENWDYGLYIDEQGPLTGLTDVYDKALYLFNVQGGWFIYDGSGNPVTSFSSYMIYAKSNAFLFMNNMNLATFFLGSIIYAEEAAGPMLAFIGNTFMSNLWWSGFFPAPGPQIISNNGSSVFYAQNSNVNFETCVVGPDQLTLTPAGAIEQDVIPDVNFSVGNRGTVKYAIQWLKTWMEFAEQQGREAKQNAAILATAVNFQANMSAGNWAGMMADDFVDASAIDPVNSKGYEVSNGQLLMTFEKFLDTFESYVSDAALRAAWVPTGVVTWNTIQTVGGDKVQRLAWTSNDVTVKYATYSLAGAARDFDTWPVELRIRLARTIIGGADNLPLTVRMTDDLGGYFEWVIAVAQVPAGGAFVNLVIPVPSTFVAGGALSGPRAFALTNVRLSVGAAGPSQVGYWDVARISVVSQQDFAQTGLIDEMEASMWTLTYPGALIFSYANPSVEKRSGAGFMILPNDMVPGWPWTLDQTFGVPKNLNNPNVVRVWVRYRGNPAMNEASWQLEMYDNVGNVVQVDSAPGNVPVVGFGTFPARAFWYPVYFHLGDAVFTVGGPGFAFGAVTRVKLSSTHVLALGQQFDLDLFEAGRTSEVTSTQATVVEDYNEVSPNISNTRPWPVAPATSYFNAQTFRVNAGGGTLQELDPTGYDVDGFSGYIDWTRNSKLMGSWQSIVKNPTNYIRWKIATMPTFAEIYTYTKKHIFEGIAVMWRNIP